MLVSSKYTLVYITPLFCNKCNLHHLQGVVTLYICKTQSVICVGNNTLAAEYTLVLLTYLKDLRIPVIFHFYEPAIYVILM